VARIAGSDPQLKNEVVVYTAHWDHFGIDETLPGPRTQQIFHGAVDNASGVAGLLQIQSLQSDADTVQAQHPVCGNHGGRTRPARCAILCAPSAVPDQQDHPQHQY
jgi:hypothetical protein